MRFSTRVSGHIRSNVVGYIALFCFAIGGTAYANHPGGANTISSADIINGEVKNDDIGANSVTSGKVTDNSLAKADLGLNSVGSFELDGDAFLPEDIKAQYTGLSKDYGIPPNAIQSDEISNGTVERVDLDEEAQGPAGFEVRKSPTGQICNDGCTEGTLSLPPGFYAISGKITVVQQDFDEDKLHVSCELTSGGVVFDEAFTRLVGDDSGNPGSTAGATPSMQGFRLLLDRGNVNLNCNDEDVGDVNGHNLKISAIKLGTATSKLAPPGD
jgi:hypothetical protein